MEIKTCEEYVVAELFDAKNEIDRLKGCLAEEKERYQEAVNCLSDVTKSFQELKDLLVEISRVNEATNYNYVTFNSIYSTWDGEQYDLLVSLVPGILEKFNKDAEKADADEKSS